VEWSPVVGVEDFPGFEVCVASFCCGSDAVDLSVGFFLVFGEVVGGSGQWVGHPQHTSAEVAGDLHVQAGGLVFPGPQSRVPGPGPAQQ